MNDSGSIINNCQKVKTIQMSIYWGMDTYNVVSLSMEYYLSKWMNYLYTQNTDEPQNYYAKW